MHITAHRATLTWLLLVALTMLAALLGRDINNSTWLIAAAIVIIVMKGFQIVEIFMGLKYAPKKWRMLFISYVIIVPSLIGIIYATSLFGFRS